MEERKAKNQPKGSFEGSKFKVCSLGYRVISTRFVPAGAWPCLWACSLADKNKSFVLRNRPFRMLQTCFLLQVLGDFDLFNLSRAYPKCWKSHTGNDTMTFTITNQYKIVACEAKRKELLHHVGVSNFTTQYIQELMDETEHGIPGAFVQMRSILGEFWRYNKGCEEDLIMVEYALLAEGKHSWGRSPTGSERYRG